MSIFSAKQTEPGAATPDSVRKPSIALYIAALVAQSASFLAIDTQVNSSSFATLLLFLSVLGCAVSYVLRVRGIASGSARIGAAIMAVVFLWTLSGRSFVASFTGADMRVTSELSVAAALAVTATLGTFFLFSDDATVFTVVWGVAIIGLSATFNINTQLLIAFAIFLLAVLFLLIHHHGLSQERAETPPGRSNRRAASGQNLLVVQASVAALAWLVAIVTGFVVAIPLQMVGKNLSLSTVLSQLKVNDTPRRPTSFRPRLTFENPRAFTVGLGPVNDDDSPVARAKTTDPFYWRGRTFDYFSGREWQTDPDVERGQKLGESTDEGQNIRAFTTSSEPLQTVRRESLSVELLNPQPQSLYAPGIARRVLLAAPEVFVRYDGTLGMGDTAVDTYTVESDVSEATPAQLDATVSRYPPEIQKRYVDQGRDNDALRVLAAEATATVAGPYEKAEAIRKFVANRCLYTLDARRVPDGANPAEFFLNESREGYCDLYATSVVLLCRQAGLPARLATGFSPGEPDVDNPGQTLLRERHRHAWAEVYFNDYGWIVFDATASTTAAATPQTPQPARREDFFAALRKLPLPALSLIAVGLVVGGTAYASERTRRRLASGRAGAKMSPKRHASLKKVMGVYGRALKTSRRFGVERTAFLSSGEHVDAVRKQLGDRAADALAPIARAHDLALFDDPSREPDLSGANSETLKTFERAAADAFKERRKK